MKTKLTPEQSAKLIELGVSPERASMRKSSVVYGKGARGIMKVPETPIFTLADILDILPKEIKVDESPYDEVQNYGLLIYPFMGGWQIDYQYCDADECQCLKCVHDTDLIEACVKAIEWLTANNYKLNQL